MTEPKTTSGKDLHSVSLKSGISLEHVAGSKADKNRRRKSIASQFAHPLTGENVKERQVKKSEACFSNFSFNLVWNEIQLFQKDSESLFHRLYLKKTFFFAAAKSEGKPWSSKKDDIRWVQVYHGSCWKLYRSWSLCCWRIYCWFGRGKKNLAKQ